MAHKRKISLFCLAQSKVSNFERSNQTQVFVTNIAPLPRRCLLHKIRIFLLPPAVAAAKNARARIKLPHSRHAARCKKQLYARVPPCTLSEEAQASAVSMVGDRAARISKLVERAKCRWRAAAEVSERSQLRARAERRFYSPTCMLQFAITNERRVSAEFSRPRRPASVELRRVAR